MDLTERFDKSYYAAYGDSWDNALFRQRILAYANTNSVVLDLGAGAGAIAQLNFRGRVAKVCGLDPDPRVRHNPHLDEGIEGVGESMPYADATFDVVISANVLEHLAKPAEVFREVRRVLKPGGVFLVKTPNRWHYVPMMAMLTPMSFHRWYNKKRGRDESHTFPTLYRANSRGAIRRIAQAADLAVEKMELVEGRPEYLRRIPGLNLLGMLYERAVNSTELLAPLRVVLIGVLRRPGELQAAPAARESEPR